MKQVFKQERIIEILLSKGKSTTGRIAIEARSNYYAIEKSLLKLEERGFLKKIKSTRGTYWEVTPKALKGDEE